MTEDRTIGGNQARRLPPSGQDIIENPSILEREVVRETDEGVPAPPRRVENTPTSSGNTPAQERESSQNQARELLGRNPPGTGDPDSRGLGSDSLYSQEDAYARGEGPPTAEREAGTARPGAPHYFVEQEHQAFYHDVIVYIEGQNVSDYLIGSLSITYGLQSSPNKCDLRLDNAGHKFTLTPENIQSNSFRTVETRRGLGSAFDYAETAKKEMFDRKSNPGYNPVDRESGGRRFPLHHWSTIFHKNDSVRCWIHNPASDRDEWLPVFTGYVIQKPTSEDYITGENTISIACADIRHNMEKMRVNQNSVLAVLPGQQATASADPLNRSQFGGAPRIFSPQSNQEFNRSFFQDLVVKNSYDNPWVSLTFRELVAALTFLKNAQATVSGAGNRHDARVNRSREEARERLAQQLQPLRTRINNGETLSARDQARYDALFHQFTIQSGGTGDNTTDGSDDTTGSSSSPGVSADLPESSPEGPPGAKSFSNTEDGRLKRDSASSRGAGRIGRMRPGVFPWNMTNRPDYVQGSVYPSNPSQDSVRKFWENWYNLCLFGSPVRTDVQSKRFSSTGALVNVSRRNITSVEVQDGPLDLAEGLRKYWTEDQVHEAGHGTRREGAWQVDAQAVHMIVPSRTAPTSDLIFEVSILQQQNVASNLNWTTRLGLLVAAVTEVDYRFWVSGCGDLVFEFAQYDFDPRDYGSYEKILTLDHHLLNETFDPESGTIITAVVANGSYIGRGDVAEGQQTKNFVPWSVGTWSPSMASRHGLNVKVVNYPQITDKIRLERLAMLTFQKYLAEADEYQIGMAFRPWLLLNKPIYNKYRDRYALIDGIRWSLPITAGAVAGQQAPTCNITLNYSRSIDELGIPRFITGGPSQPMYFGERRGRNILSALTRRITSFQDAIRQLHSSENPITQEDLVALRDEYNALIPVRQDTFNVIDAALQGPDSAGRGEGELSTTTQQLSAAALLCDEVVQNAGALSQDQIRDRLRQCEEQTEAARESIREDGLSAGPEQGPGGTRPDVDRSGVRSTLGSVEDIERPPEGPPEDEELCFPGDPEMYSSPLGRQSLSVVPKFTQWISQLGRDTTSSQRNSILTSFGRGQVEDPFEGLSSSTGVFQVRGDFPRVYTNGYGGRGGSWHPGVDLPASVGDPVYSVADGIVINIEPAVSKGAGIGILHKNGFATFYRHLGDDISVEIGDTVKRNQQIATVGLAGRSARVIAETHLHFECAAIKNSPAFSRWVGNSSKRFRIVIPSVRDDIVASATGLSLFSSTSTDALTSKQRREVLTIASTPRDRASIRVITARGTSRRTRLASVSAELKDRFNLSFLRTRVGSDFILPATFLTYHPGCVGVDPFVTPEIINSSAGAGGSLISQRDYFETFGLKGIPAVNKPLIPSSDFRPLPVPAVTSSGRSRDREIRARDSAIQKNIRRANRLALKQAQLAAQIALYNDAIPPEDCPPERYEGDVPRQPGEPLPDQRRTTRTEAGAAYRRRELLGDS